MSFLTVIAITSALLVIATIASGIYFTYKDTPATKPKLKKFLRMNLSVFIPTIASSFVIFVPNIAAAAGGDASVSGTAYIAAAIATGVACLGSAYAVATVGSAALGAISENEKIFGKTLIFGGLAEGIAIYGLIIAIMIISSL